MRALAGNLPRSIGVKNNDSRGVLVSVDADTDEVKTLPIGWLGIFPGRLRVKLVKGEMEHNFRDSMRR